MSKNVCGDINRNQYSFTRYDLERVSKPIFTINFTFSINFVTSLTMDKKRATAEKIADQGNKMFQELQKVSE